MPVVDMSTILDASFCRYSSVIFVNSVLYQSSVNRKVYASVDVWNNVVRIVNAL